MGVSLAKVLAQMLTSRPAKPGGVLTSGGLIRPKRAEMLTSAGCRKGQPSCIPLSEHGVVVRCTLRDRLHYVPVLDHLAVLQAKDVRCGGAAVFG